MSEAPQLEETGEGSALRSDGEAGAVEEVPGYLRRRWRGLEARRADWAALDVFLRLVDRHRAIAGTLLAGALGYRLFVVTLPMTLIAVGLLGFGERTTSADPEAVTKALGVSGLMASVIRTSGREAEHLRWFTLLGGIVLLLWATWALLRALRTIHAFAWGVPVVRLGSPAVAVLVASGLMMLSTALAAGVNEATAAWPFVALVANAALLIAYAGVWLALSLYLPHAAERWTGLVPGSVLFALGVKALHVFTIYYVAPFLDDRVGTYGALGYASMALLLLYAFGELAVLSALLNAAVTAHHHEKRGRSEGAAG